MACYLTPVRHSARTINPFFPRFQPHDLAPLFKLFDESFEPAARGSLTRSFQPRFDVREEKDAFLLQGEVPGVSQQDLKIEFADQNTLTVHGRTVRESKKGTPPSAAATAVESNEKAAVADAPAATSAEAEAEAAPASSASSSHQATVEDENEDGWVATPATNNNTTTAAAAPEETPAESSTTAAEKKPASNNANTNNKPSSRYWVSERSVGEFHRSFKFPGHVDQDAVKASLQNGVLSIIVPKMAAREPRQITVE